MRVILYLMITTGIWGITGYISMFAAFDLPEINELLENELYKENFQSQSLMFAGIWAGVGFIMSLISVKIIRDNYLVMGSHAFSEQVTKTVILAVIVGAVLMGVVYSYIDAPEQFKINSILGRLFKGALFGLLAQAIASFLSNGFLEE